MFYKDDISGALSKYGKILSEEDFAELLPKIVARNKTNKTGKTKEAVIAYIGYIDRYGEEGHFYTEVGSEDDIELLEARQIRRSFWLVGSNHIAEYCLWSS